MSADARSDDDNVFLDNGSEFVIIREIYDGAHEVFENELERALESGCETIVIEPTRLGEETARWITIGNCLRKTAVVTGFGSVLSGIAWPEKPLMYGPMATISVLSSGIHAWLWQFDPCSNYRVESDTNKIFMHSMESPDSPTPIVLMKRRDSEIRQNNILHTAISLIAFAFSAWKLYKCFKFTVI